MQEVCEMGKGYLLLPRLEVTTVSAQVLVDM